MPTVVDRDRAVGLLRAEFEAIEGLGATLDEAAWRTPTCLPGWTVQDNLSHMVGTESALAGVAMPPADVAHLAHVRNPIGEVNEGWVESMRSLPGAEVLDRFRAITAQRLAALDAMTQADFDAPSWTPAGRDETYGRFMRIRHYDCFLHEHDMRDALGLPDREDPEHVRFALEEVTAALGYVVGRKAGLPDGSTVRIHVTGAHDDTFHVAVDGRARVVDTSDGEPTVTMTLPAMLYLRLTGGRTTAAANAGGIVLAGDAELGRRLASSLAFTI